MCMSCGCGHPKKAHHDPRNIVWMDLKAAAKAAGIEPELAAKNILSACEHQLAKAEVACQVFKATPERRYTLGVAYPANRPDVGKAADGFRDFASPEVLEDAAWSYLRKGGLVGLDHMDGTDGAGEVVESYIWPGPPWDTGTYVVEKGDWLLGVLWTPEAWADIKAGLRSGFSPQGGARRRQPSPEAMALLRACH